VNERGDNERISPLQGVEANRDKGMKEVRDR